MSNNNENMEEYEVIILTDEKGNELEFELLDIVQHDDAEYIVTMPTDEEGQESNEVVILLIENIDDETETYVAIEDEEVLETVFKKFKEKYEDEFDFID